MYFNEPSQYSSLIAHILQLRICPFHTTSHIAALGWTSEDLLYICFRAVLLSENFQLYKGTYACAHTCMYTHVYMYVHVKFSYFVSTSNYQSTIHTAEHSGSTTLVSCKHCSFRCAQQIMDELESIVNCFIVHITAKVNHNIVCDQ